MPPIWRRAARLLFQSGASSPDQIDYLLYCTQSPDYIVPSTACLLHHALELPRSAGALDVSLGCSGFVFALGVAKGLVETGQARKVLLLCADTYSKYLRPDDLSVRTLFGDAGAACLIESSSVEGVLGPFVYGTDGRGKEHLIVRPGGFRGTAESPGAAPRLTMNGPEVFSFALQAVPALVEALLSKAQIGVNQVDYWVFHQASLIILEQLAKKIGIPVEKMANYLADYGNTVCCSIPIALKCSLAEGRLKPGVRVVLAGFGVGYSFAACLLKWDP